MIYIPLWLKLYLWKQEALHESKASSSCAVYQGPNAKRRGLLLSCKNNFPSYTNRKQKEESIALFLEYYTSLQGVGSY